MRMAAILAHRADGKMVMIMMMRMSAEGRGMAAGGQDVRMRCMGM